MTTQAGKADEIFWRALEFGSADERAGYLAEACGGDARSSPKSMSCSRVSKGRAIPGKPAAEVGVTIGQPAMSERPGTLIGPYKLLQQIGEGGMGIVFMAEQTEPVQRAGGAEGHQAGHGHAAGHRPLRGRAAGPGADGPPNIAKVLDAGHDRQPAGRTS